MSIPIRLWRVLRGRLIQVREGTGPVVSRTEAQVERAREIADAARAHADAARELGEQIVTRRPRAESQTTTEDQRPTTLGVEPTTDRGGTAPRTGSRDPLAEEWKLLQVTPGADLETVEAAYRARLEETAPERHPEGSPERAGAERRTAHLTAAYERLRDALNTTETRFERLEF